jgi:competence protein ComEA
VLSDHDFVTVAEKPIYRYLKELCMFKKVLAISAILFAGAAFAAVDVNTGTATELAAVRGVGTGMANDILRERSMGIFKDWNDFTQRMRLAQQTATALATAGLSIKAVGLPGVSNAPAPAPPVVKPADTTARPAQASASTPLR